MSDDINQVNECSLLIEIQFNQQLKKTYLLQSQYLVLLPNN